MSLYDFIGIYYVYDYRTKSHGQEYLLEIMESAKDKLEFIFYTTASGNFGSSGIIWKGNVTLRDHQLYLKAFEKNEWRFTAIDEEKEENIQKIFHQFNFEILKESENIFLISVLYEKTIKLVRLNKSIDRNKLYSIVYWIIQEIIDRNKLRGDSLEFEPSRFWRISNLLVKTYNEIEMQESKTIEIICEYNLEYVKEEKRVVERDEILAEHHVDRAIFNKNLKMVNYENLE